VADQVEKYENFARGNKKEPNAWGYNRAFLCLGDIKIRGPVPSRLGNLESETYGLESHGTDPRITALARSNSNCKRQTHPLVREDVT
jgi:hypothetical protein